ncbi:MAG TPA: HAMP domain-containing sensor histidine kinase [Gemmatimonadales bacterium]|nr:HAMP domain-containing sensor histidine kinase [Gemmatimonadales bacterium]
MSQRADPLARLRFQLTLWYGGVFTLILVLLGGGVFFGVRRQLSRQLDTSLRSATVALQRAARIRDLEREQATGPVADAVSELHIPDRMLFLLDTAGTPIIPAQAPGWVQAAARDAALNGQSDLDMSEPGDREIRLHAQRFTGSSGHVYIAAVAADRVELESRYASLIEVFAAAAFVAMLLVAGGGYVLVRQSTAPVERSMDQMRRFMADAAHELRTPVTLLRTRAEVALAEERDPRRDAETLHAVVREVERVGAIVSDLLTLARADAGEQPATRKTVYLDDLASDAVDSIRSLAAQHQVTVGIGSFEEAPITGDPVLVRRLLLILLDNAIKFTPVGGDVRLDVTVADGRRVVAITDTGVGIPPEDLPRVFERFFRSDTARQETDGAGLGLAIARWIADQHGASLGVRSKPGAGTTVTVSFPSGV